MMVKKTCRNKLTALINTASKKSHASPDIILSYGEGAEVLSCDVAIAISTGAHFELDA